MTTNTIETVAADATLPLIAAIEQAGEQEAKAPKLPTLWKRTVHVPAGHYLAKDVRVIHPFTLHLIIGAEWRPYQDKPVIVAKAARKFSLGDGLVWHGNMLFDSFGEVLTKLPLAARLLVAHHGEDAGVHAEALANLGLAAPSEPQGWADFSLAAETAGATPFEG